MLKSEPFTTRISEQTEKWIEAQAEKTGRPRDAILQSLAEEAARTRRFPGIGFRGPANARRAWLLGTALDVWQCIDLYQDVGSVGALVNDWHVSETQVRLALAYFEEYPEEIGLHIARKRMPPEYWHALYPDVIPASAE